MPNNGFFPTCSQLGTIFITLFAPYYWGLIFQRSTHIVPVRDSVTRFSTIFSLLKRFDLGHIWTGLVLQPFLFSRKYSVAKFENRVSEQSLTSQTCNFFFRYGDFHIFELLLLVMKMPPINFFCLIVPLRAMRRLQSFLKVSAKSMTTPTQCQCGQPLSGHSNFENIKLNCFTFLSFLLKNRF